MLDMRGPRSTLAEGVFEVTYEFGPDSRQRGPEETLAEDLRQLDGEASQTVFRRATRRVHRFLLLVGVRKPR